MREYMMRGYIKYIAFFVVIFLSILWLGGFFSKKIPTNEVAKEVKVVQGLIIRPVEKLDYVETPYVGHVVADQRAEISTRIMGRVLEVYVKEGECVRAGRLLVKVDASDVQAQVDAIEHQRIQAEKAYESALAHYEAVKKTYDRYAALLKQSAITQQEFDQVKAQFESARAQVEQAKASIEALKAQKSAISSNLAYANLTAPFDGCVVLKNVDVGDLAMPGQPMLVLEKAPYKVEAYLPERFLGKVKVGSTLRVEVDGKVFEGRVVESGVALDPSSRTFRIKLLVPSSGLFSGKLARVLIPQEQKVIMVPQSAIVKRFDFTGVWVVKEDNTLELRFVRLGDSIEDKVQVLSGLKEGERVVVEGIERACEGCKVGG